MSLGEKIRKSFIEYTLENEKKPTVYLLCKKNKIKENEFYEHFNSIENIESEIWKDFFEESKTKIESDDTYVNYSVREKLLAFYYTWIEVLKENRSYILQTFPQMKDMEVINNQLSQFQEFKEAFKEFSEVLLSEATETGEIPTRTFISSQYPRIFWVQALSILNFWVKDHSKAFEKTDAMIEKSVNFAFDLMGRSFLDSSFDFFKFIFQNRS